MYYDRTNIKYYSKFLIRLAWTVEVIAVLIGFTISILMAVSAYNSIATYEQTNAVDSTSAILIAGLPFLLVAVVELCKIPLVFTFMNVKNLLWRGIFLFFVLFLCIITFETMLNGFERNFSNLSRAIDNRKNEIINVDAQIELLEKRKQHRQKFTEDELLSEIETQTQTADEELNQTLSVIELSQRKQLANINSGFEPGIKQDIEKMMAIRDEYYRDWNAEKELIEERFTSTIVSNVSGSKEERQRLLTELNELKAEMKRELDDSNFFTRAAVEKKYRALVTEKERQLATITTGFLGGTALEQQSTMENQLRQQIEFVNKKYERRIKDINERIDEKKQEIVDRYSQNARLRNAIVNKAKNEKNKHFELNQMTKAEIESYQVKKLAELEVISQAVFELDEQIFKLRNDQRLLNTQINHLMNQNQVYRLAMYVYGKESAEQVERQMVGIVALVWFGSLALIAAVTGVMLALASFYLRRFAAELDATDPIDEVKTVTETKAPDADAASNEVKDDASVAEPNKPTSE
ncbi:hypothetical protein [Shewanella marina]|uniref:hypothetical protein n=1 Tax=Shewanella marina TaxID=487319 RepID=UPI00046F8BF8|nr:hypothetical protein [Shewanella marina]